MFHQTKEVPSENRVRSKKSPSCQQPLLPRVAGPDHNERLEKKLAELEKEKKETGAKP